LQDHFFRGWTSWHNTLGSVSVSLGEWSAILASTILLDNLVFGAVVWKALSELLLLHGVHSVSSSEICANTALTILLELLSLLAEIWSAHVSWLSSGVSWALLASTLVVKNLSIRTGILNASGTALSARWSHLDWAVVACSESIQDLTIAASWKLTLLIVVDGDLAVLAS